MAIIVSRSPALAFASNERLHVAWWRMAPDGPGVRAWADAVEAWLLATSGPRVVAAVVDGVGPPNADARTLMVGLLEKCSKAKATPAVLVIGGGFKASLQRSAIAAVGFLARDALPIVVADDAASLLAKLGPEHRFARTDFEAVFQAARDEARRPQLEARAPV
jgi:hypothetical protein